MTPVKLAVFPRLDIADNKALRTCLMSELRRVRQPLNDCIQCSWSIVVIGKPLGHFFSCARYFS